MTRNYRSGSSTPVRVNLTRAVQAAIAAAPCSLRALARAAGVPHVTLVQVRQGAIPASPAVARGIAGALEQWGTRCSRAARKVRAAARRVPTPRMGRNG